MKYILFVFVFFFSIPCYSLDQNEYDHLRTLAKKGDSEAMYNLFLDVAERLGDQEGPTQEEFIEARGWLIKAGELNNWRAAYVLQLCYTHGCWGFRIDNDKANHYKSVYEKYRPENLE